MTRRQRTLLIAAALLAAAILGLYGQVLRHQYVRLDDDKYVFENPMVLQGFSGESIRWAFTTSHASNWHPLTWLSHLSDVEVFGPEPGPAQFINAVLHAANTVLLLFFVHRLTGCLNLALIVAVLFGLHPLRVESVAWAAERKDVLSGLFWLLACHAYLSYVRHRKRGAYVLVSILLALGLMAKPVLVSLPLVFLLLDYGVLQRGRETPARTLVLEKGPWMGLVTASALVTMWVQRSAGSFSSIESIPFSVRLANAAVAYVAYLESTLWPAGLSCFYPHPAAVFASPLEAIAVPALLSAAALLGITALVLLWAMRRDRWPAVGWFWFLGTMVPMAGLVQVGGQAWADRYSYIPLIGIYFALGALARHLSQRIPTVKPVLAGLAMVTVLGLAYVTYRQVGVWKDSATLFEHALRVTERNYVAHNNLGMEYTAQRRFDEAAAQFRAALEVKPDLVTARYNLGFVHIRSGDMKSAQRCFEETLRLDPGHASAHNNLGRILEMNGRDAEAIEHYRTALRAPKAPGIAARNLAWLLSTSADAALRDGSEALRWAQVYAQSQPGALDAWTTLAAASAQAGQFEDAVAIQEQAMSAAPESMQADMHAHLQQYRSGQPYRALEENASPTP